MRRVCHYSTLIHSLKQFIWPRNLSFRDDMMRVYQQSSSSSSSSLAAENQLMNMINQMKITWNMESIEYCKLMQFYCKEERMDLAELLVRNVKIPKSSGLLNQLLANAWIRKGDLARAAAIIENHSGISHYYNDEERISMRFSNDDCELVHLYYKNGMYAEALTIFEEMDFSMISLAEYDLALEMYSKLGKLENADEIYSKLQSINEAKNLSFESIKAFAKLYIRQKEYSSANGLLDLHKESIEVLNGAIEAYIDSDQLERAKEKFLTFPKKNCASYELMIKIHCRENNIRSCFDVFDSMLFSMDESEISHSVFISLFEGLSGFSKEIDIDFSLKLDHYCDYAVEIYNSNPSFDLAEVYEAIVGFFMSCGTPDQIIRLLEKTQEKNIKDTRILSVLYNGMIEGLVYKGDIGKVESMFQNYLSNPKDIKFSTKSFSILIKYLLSLKKVGKARLFFNMLIDTKPSKDLVQNSCNVMIQGLLENGFEEDAFDLFNKMRKGSDNSSLDFPDRNVYSTILDFYLKNRDIENAYTILNEMIQSSNANSNPSFSSYALFFSYFIKNNDFIQLEQMIDKMLRESTIPLNAEIYAHIFSESVKYSNVQEGLRYLRKSQRLMNNQTTMHEMIPLLFHRVQIPPKLK